MQKKILAKQVNNFGNAMKYAVELEKVNLMHNSSSVQYWESTTNKSYHKTARQNTWKKPFSRQSSRVFETNLNEQLNRLYEILEEKPLVDKLLEFGASASYVNLKVAKKLELKIDRTLDGSEVKFPDSTVVVSSGVARLREDLDGKSLDLVQEVLPGWKNTVILPWLIAKST